MLGFRLLLEFDVLFKGDLVIENFGLHPELAKSLDLDPVSINPVTN
jgi:hypothetical protein